MTSQRYLRVMVLLGALLWSSLSFASYDASTCDNLTSTSDFGINFSIDSANLKETVNALKGVGSDTKATVPLWSNDSTVSSPVIRDGITQENGSYEVWLKYEAINDTNKTGLLSYYLLIDGQWKLITADQEADLRDLKSVQVKVTNVGVNEMACGNTATPPPIATTFDQCEYFPQPVQSWITEGTSDYSTFPESVLDVRNNAEIKGWSQAYVSDPINIYRYSENGSSWDTLRVGFDQVSDKYWAYQKPNSTLCNGDMGCYPGNDDGNINLRKAQAPDPLNVDFSATTELSITPDNYTSVCDGVVCTASFTNNVYDIVIKQDLKKLTLGFYGDKANVSFFGTRTIEDITTGNGVTLNMSEHSVLTIGSATFDGASGYISFKSAARINVVNTFNSGNSTLYFTYEESSDFTYPMIYGPQASMIFHSPSGQTIKGFLLGKEIAFPNASTVEGAITANKLIVESGLTLIPLDGSPDCWDGGSEESDYALTLQPTEAYALICEDQRIEFQVVDNNNQATGDFTGTISVSPTTANLAVVPDKGSGSNGSYTPNASGELWLDLTASSSQTVTITGTLNPQGDSASVSGTYHFVPYKLSASDQYVIANKPQTVEVKALACDDNGGVVDINYGGTPTVSSAWVAPTSGAGELTFAPAFTQGVASSELTMEDSGIKTVTMTDSSFDCSGLTDCPVEGSGTLQGSFTVYSRPWTLAICSPNGSAMDGDITNPDSLAFTSAGNLFALNIRPLRWVSGSGDDSSPQAGGNAIETSAYCSSAVTQNFFSDNSQLAALAVLSHQVAQPADGNDGTLDGTLEQLNTTGINSTYLPFSGLSWSEVGVLRVNADISGSYLGMTVNQGYRDIGRFYPAWLSITENNWDYADDHNGFVYMNQTIPYRFTVEAQNMQSDATTNYSAFSQALIADVKLLAVDSDGEELSDRIDEYDLQLWDGSGDGAWSGATLSVTNDFTFLKQQKSASPYTSSVDGPYQSGFGLRVSDKVDGVDFASPDLELKASTTLLDTGKAFATQPDIRYGRMALKDVGGTSVSTINVPLRVEYWQGSRFVTNSDDSGSHFATPDDYICRQTVWSQASSSANATLSGSDTSSNWTKVASGQSSTLFAHPASLDESVNDRQQLRFWLRLDDDAHSSPQLSESGVNCGAQYTAQPWLQYNWRDKGDEDPSAVVTFGIHRGNDKVIFRGETRLTGQ
ncbi:MSHA biogenesis protein MshQ [Vibrio fluvialis]|uniref:DUF6701 domain-containing protein n=1 Tax=Vibrio fluvialis TaxID=676 RepID=UPI001F1768CE|nr:DUF6701 domain-containing protein [Vibrio fluvialis]MCE7615320.1 MSHA biogenesis protein MshQ [Vibrio fluvialis]